MNQQARKQISKPTAAPGIDMPASPSAQGALVGAIGNGLAAELLPPLPLGALAPLATVAGTPPTAHGARSGGSEDVPAVLPAPAAHGAAVTLMFRLASVDCRGLPPPPTLLGAGGGRGASCLLPLPGCSAAAPAEAASACISGIEGTLSMGSDIAPALGLAAKQMISMRLLLPQLGRSSANLTDDAFQLTGDQRLWRGLAATKLSIWWFRSSTTGVLENW